MLDGFTSAQESEAEYQLAVGKLRVASAGGVGLAAYLGA